MNSSSEQHMDLLLLLINVKLFNSFDGRPSACTVVLCFQFSQVFFFLMVALTCFLSHLLPFSCLLCFPNTCVCQQPLSLPRHSWRSDRHGESVGQQPWNKYGWSWVRWARIICFAICLCESVYVMTVVLPSTMSPLFAGKAPDKKSIHTEPKNIPHACTYIHLFIQEYHLNCTQSLEQGTVHTRAFTESHRNRTAQHWLPYCSQVQSLG